MNVQIVDKKEDENKILTFNISGLDVSYVNAIRRVIFTDVPIVVLKTTPYADFKDHIITNTTRLSNEILGQRLSCIPICLKDIPSFLDTYKDYQLELDVENNTDNILYVTTDDFKIKNKNTNTYLEKNDMRKLFPPYLGNGTTENFIDFVRLRPKLSDKIPGEKIKLKCDFAIGSHRESGMFNVVSTCSYGYTPDYTTMKSVLDSHEKLWKEQGKTPEEIESDSKNWQLLEGLRYYITNSFDFIIQSVGIYENDYIIDKACDVLIRKLLDMNTQLDTDALSIYSSDTTMDNCYDILLENEDYTVGNILNHEIYRLLFQNEKKVSYVGFKKIHPHDTNSLLRVAFTNETDGEPQLKMYLKSIIELSVMNIQNMKSYFSRK